MRKLLLIPLLLLGSLQAATRPAATVGDPAGPLRFHAGALPTGPAPADTPTALKRLAESSRQSALSGDGKLQKGDLTAAPRLAPARDGDSSRHPRAGSAVAESCERRPRQPRAPPAPPSL